MAVQYCNYDIKGTLAVTGTSTLTGAVTITAATSSLLSIQNTTNGGGAAIRFMDTSAGSQPGDLTYKHSDSQSQGGGASWHFVAEDQTHVVVGDGSKVGRVIVKSGGTATKADYGFFDDVNTGMYRAAADTVRLAGGGVYNLGVSADNVALYYQSGLRFSTTDSGASIAGGLSIAGQNDTMLDLNQTGTDTGWSYINFKTLGTRNYYVGQDASKNFNIYNDNIDVVAISVSYASNLTTIGGDLTVSGGDITLSGTGRIQGVDTVSSGTDAANKTYVDNAVSGLGPGTVTSVATTNGITGGTITSTGTIQVDSTVVRTTGAQTIANLKTFTERTDFTNASGIRTNQVRTYGGQQLVLNAGESSSYFTGQTNELVYLNAESGIQINSSPDNWNTGWASRNTTTINDSSGNSTFANDITVSGGDITLGGTGRIQGVDTVSASTDAANKAYVDAHVSPAGTYLPLAGGTMSGAINMSDNDIDAIDELKFSSGTKLGDDGNTQYIRLTYASTGGGGIVVKDGDNTTQGYLYADGTATSSFGLLDGTGAWAVRCLEDQYVELRYDNAVKLRTATGGIGRNRRSCINNSNNNC